MFKQQKRVNIDCWHRDDPESDGENRESDKFIHQYQSENADSGEQNKV